MSLITIDQLLESVDLDFEPRWVTKDENGTISFHSYETKPRKLDACWAVKDCFYEFDGRLKVAEFDGKDWTECIYEVPRKTTGKIEKFDKNSTSPMLNSHSLIVNKINELVDAVNELKGLNQ